MIKKKSQKDICLLQVNNIITNRDYYIKIWIKFVLNLNNFNKGNAIYILRPYDITEKLRIPLKQITKITISNKNCNLVVRIKIIKIIKIKKI